LWCELSAKHTKISKDSNLCPLKQVIALSTIKGFADIFEKTPLIFKLILLGELGEE
jgi:hypothetical protein